jgi:thioredoxin 1
MATVYLVAILCASWCSSCERFRPDFLAADLGDLAVHRLWIDIEDHADALPDRLDLASLPMLLVASTRAEVAFFGPVRPDLQVVQRLARTPGMQAGAEELLARVVGHWLEPHRKESTR